MFKKFLRHQKYKKKIKVSSSFILEEFSQVVAETIDRFEKEGQIKMPVQKEVMKFEATALVFWLFQKSDIFPELYHKLLLDEIHKQYYEGLRKHGYDFNIRQVVCDDFNVRYKTYNEIFGDTQDLSSVGAKFVHIVSEKSKAEWNIKDMSIPLLLTKKLTPKFHEWRKVIKG